jgi:hypothetical protein
MRSMSRASLACCALLCGPAAAVGQTYTSLSVFQSMSDDSLRHVRVRLLDVEPGLWTIPGVLFVVGDSVVVPEQFEPRNLSTTLRHSPREFTEPQSWTTPRG